MKYHALAGLDRIVDVAPHWGAWIEIQILEDLTDARAVAPHWGAWIEITAWGRPCSGLFLFNRKLRF